MKEHKLLVPTEEQKNLMKKNGIEDTALWMIWNTDNISITIVHSQTGARKVLFK